MNLTETVVVSGIGFWVVYDIWTLVKFGMKSTISWNMLNVSRQYPIVPFAIGVVMGHLFWPNCG